MADSDDPRVSWSDLPGRRVAPPASDFGTVPVYTPPQPPRQRSRVAVAAIALGVLATLGGAIFAVTQLSGDEGSPEDAVQKLFDAVADEDVIGVLEALPPSERDPLKDSVPKITDELKRLEILSGDFDLNKVAGVDFAFEDIKMTSSSLTENLASVSITGGTVKTAADPSKIPLGSFVRETAGGALSEARPVSEVEPLGSFENIVTLKEDGKWYVSLWYSLAEAARRGGGGPLPDPKNRLEPRGADTPEAAIEELMRAGAGLDVRRLFELLPPDEARALHDYAPLFVDDAARASQEMKQFFNVEITKLRVESETDGDQAMVRVREFGFNGTFGEPGDEQFAVSYENGCVGFGPAGGGEERFCAGDFKSGEALRRFGLSEEDIPKFDVGTPDLGFVAVERDGKWYFSPVRTGLENFVAMLRVFDRPDLDQIRDFFIQGLLGDFESSIGTAESEYQPVD